MTIEDCKEAYEPAPESELNADEPSSVSSWARVLGTNEALLWHAIAVVGCDLRALRIHLARRAPWRVAGD
jgi:hypothetical protein